MKGLDTNILVRYLTQDEPRQAARATKAIEGGADAEETFFIAAIVVCELVWVLETAYEYGRPVVAEVLDHLLRTRQFQFEEKDVLWQSLSDYRASTGDFADFVIGRCGSNAGCEHTLTFDKALRDHPNFQML